MININTLSSQFINILAVDKSKVIQRKQISNSKESVDGYDSLESTRLGQSKLSTNNKTTTTI